MLSQKRLENYLGIILQIAIIISIVMVLLGGSWFLSLHGNEALNNNPFIVNNHQIHFSLLWQQQHWLSPFGLIEIGLLILVIAQVLRVAMLTGYYLFIRDYWFMVFSLFILSVILYSLVRH